MNQITPGIDLSVQLQASDTEFRGVLIIINKDGVWIYHQICDQHRLT